MIFFEIVGGVSTFILGVILGMSLRTFVRTGLPFRDCLIIAVNKLLDMFGFS